MVAVLHAAPRAAAPQAVSAWLASLIPDYSDDERASLAEAFEFARGRTGDAAMADGEPALDRALGTATILAGLKLDADSLRAALLLGVPVAGTFDTDEIAGRFGPDVATLVAGVAAGKTMRDSYGRARRRTRKTRPPGGNLRKMCSRGRRHGRSESRTTQSLRARSGATRNGASARDEEGLSSSHRWPTGWACGNSSGSSRT